MLIDTKRDFLSEKQCFSSRNRTHVFSVENSGFQSLTHSASHTAAVTPSRVTAFGARDAMCHSPCCVRILMCGVQTSWAIQREHKPMNVPPPLDVQILFC